ncbi:hypothetical protein FA13DRAFT_1596385, partial [Coprinellus micaceus]
PLKPRVRPERSKQFYYDDGAAVIIVSRVLYRLHPSILGKRSPILGTMFTLPQKGERSGTLLASAEGFDDDHPILLPYPHFTIQKFDHLLTYLFVGPSSYPMDDQFLLNVLDLSHFLDIADGVEFVIQTFDARTEFNAVLKFRLAHKYRIMKWLEPALREMLKWSGAVFTQQDAIDLGFHVFYEIISTKSKVEELRKGMAYNAPELVRGILCPVRRYEKCKAVWEDVWWSELGRHILHPGWSTAGQLVKEQLNETMIPGVCPGCQLATV